MKTLSSYLAITAAVLILAGCAPKNNIVGTWKATLPAGNQVANMTITFNPDGHEVQTIQAPGQTIRIQASYKAKDGTLTHTVEQGTINGKPVKPKVATASFTYKVEGDKLTLSQQGVSSSLVLTRAPS
jgi:hypothetical protein